MFCLEDIPVSAFDILFSGSGGGRPSAWTETIIYDHLIEKPKDTVPDVPGFTLVKSVPIRFTFTVEGGRWKIFFP